MLSKESIHALQIILNLDRKQLFLIAEESVAKRFEHIASLDKIVVQASSLDDSELEHLKKRVPHKKTFYLLSKAEQDFCFICERFMHSEQAKELLGLYAPEELSAVDTKNQMFYCFSKNEIKNTSFASEAILYSAVRVPDFQTVTKVLEADGELFVRKDLLSGKQSHTIGNLTLQATESKWQYGTSVQQDLSDRLKQDMALDEALLPIANWLRAIEKHAQNGSIAGSFIDAIWANSFLLDDELTLIDTEWLYAKEINYRVLFIRSAYQFFTQGEGTQMLSLYFKNSNVQQAIKKCAQHVGLALSEADFAAFLSLESELQAAVLGLKPSRLKATIQLQLFSSKLYQFSKWLSTWL